MSDVPFGTTVFDRDRGNLPKFPVINMFAEKTDIEGVVMQSRPGLTDTGRTMGVGPVQAMIAIDGVLNYELYTVSGPAGSYKLYHSDGTFIGNMDGSNHVSMAEFESRVFACGGQSVWTWDGAVYAAIVTPGGFNVSSMCVGSDRLVVIDKGTGHFYWSDVLSTTVDALSFATAENSPDKLLECLFLGDTLLLFGSETVEQWPASSANPDLPFTPLVGRTFQVGIRDTGCAVLFSNSFAWITSNNQVCVGDPSTVISTPSLDEKISNSTTAKMWTFKLEGVQFLAIRLDTETWVFSASSSQWSQFESYGQTNWIPQCYSQGLFGSSVDNKLIVWGTDHSDFSGVMERRLGAGVPITSGTVGINNLIIRTNPGHTPYLSGNYVDPIVEIRTSRDGGFTWSEWKQKSLGANGRYNKSIMWRSLGYFGCPGFLMEIRVTDPVPFRLSGIVVNEDYARI